MGSFGWFWAYGVYKPFRALGPIGIRILFRVEGSWSEIVSNLGFPETPISLS